MSTTDRTTTGTGQLPAAWYPDPAGRHEMRWWDGGEWTDRVADGQELGVDPPVPSAALPATAPPVEPDDTVEPEPAVGFEPEPVVAAEPFFEPEPVFEAEPVYDVEPARDPEPATLDPEPALEAEPASGDPNGGFDQLRPGRLPLEARPTTGAASDLTTPQRRAVLVVCAVIALLCLGWGLYNHRTAGQWQERGEELQAELDRQASNGDALEDALGSAASRGAQLADGQEAIQALNEATAATITQLEQCARDLNAVLGTMGSADSIAQANQTCGAAAANGAALRDILDQIVDL